MAGWPHAASTVGASCVDGRSPALRRLLAATSRRAGRAAARRPGAVPVLLRWRTRTIRARRVPATPCPVRGRAGQRDPGDRIRPSRTRSPVAARRCPIRPMRRASQGAGSPVDAGSAAPNATVGGRRRPSRAPTRRCRSPRCRARTIAKRGTTVELKLKIKNISTRTCTRDVGADLQEIYVKSGRPRRSGPRTPAAPPRVRTCCRSPRTSSGSTGSPGTVTDGHQVRRGPGRRTVSGGR